ncbi:MAG: hypothetical protein N2C14_27195, partial [Planctomycetales bacterium]
ILFGYLAIRRAPLIAVRGESIYVTHSVFFWRKARLPIGDVLDVAADWNEDGDSGHARIAFLVTESEFKAQTRYCNTSGVFATGKQKGVLCVEAMFAEMKPDVAAERLREALGLETCGVGISTRLDGSVL